MSKDKKEIDLKIKVYEADRDSVPQRKLAKEGIIPGFGNCLAVGLTQSGKTMAILNLLKRPEFWGMIDKKHYFNEIFLFSLSPSRLLENNLEGILKEKHIFHEPKPAVIQTILDKQEALIKKDFKKAPHLCVILDDVISDPKFLRSPQVSRLFYQGTNFKITTIICSQSYRDVKRGYRINSHFLLLFGNNMNASEVERIAEDYTPKGMKQRDFINIFNDVCKEPYSFMFINNKLPPSQKYFQNFDNHIIFNQGH